MENFKLIRKLLQVGCVILWITQPCLAKEAAAWQLEGKYWLADIGAGGNYVTTVYNEKLDLQRDLGYSGSQVPMWALSWQVNPKNRIEADYFNGGFSGVGRQVRQETVFLGPFPVTRDVTYVATSNIQLRYGKVSWVHLLWSKPHKKMDVSVSLSLARALVHANGRVDWAISNPIPVFLGEGEAGYGVTAPLVGLQLSSRLNRQTDATIKLSGLTTGKAYFLDGEAAVEHFWDAKRTSSITVGYRVLAYENQQETSRTQLTSFKLAGGYYGVKVYF